MIIWNGLGFLVAVIGFGALLVTEIVSEQITEDDQFYQQHSWLILVGMTVAALLTFGLDKLLFRRKERVLIDQETGQKVVFRPNHSLFFIPVRWWPVVFLILGVAFAILAPAS